MGGTTSTVLSRLDSQNEYLKENGMIAYVLQNDFQYWFGKINQWIIDTRWESSEKLALDYSDSTAKLISKHMRVDRSEFILHHFWVNVSNLLWITDKNWDRLQIVNEKTCWGIWCLIWTVEMIRNLTIRLSLSPGLIYYRLSNNKIIESKIAFHTITNRLF